MSSQEFTCHVWSGVDEAKEYFVSLKQLFIQLPAENALDLINEKLDAGFEKLPRINLQIKAGDELEVRTEFGSETPYELIEAIITSLENVDGIEFKARYFDSGSGAVSAWGNYDDLDLDDKNILLLGDMSEETEYLQELIEGIGVLQEALDDDTEIIILGANPDVDILSEAKKQKVEFITEDQFLEYISIQP